MSMWDQSVDAAIEAQDDIDKSGSPATPDQKIALAQVWATLSVAQELSRMIQDEGLSVRVESTKPAEQYGGMTVHQSPADQRIPTRSTGR